MSNPYTTKPKAQTVTNEEPEVKVSASRREQLHSVLVGILGSSNVYYQPPANVKMEFPAIVYRMNSIRRLTANDNVYNLCRSYEVIVVSKTPDSAAVNAILELQNATYTRHYVSDNLYHDVITLFY